MAEAAVYDEKLREYVLQTFGDISHRYSGLVPGIRRFSELISVNHTMNHHNYICRSFSERSIPFPGNRDFYYRHTFPVRTEILKVHIHRTDQFTLRTDTVVSSLFSDGKNIYRFRLCVTGSFSAENRSFSFVSVSLSGKTAIPENIPLSDYLIPYLKKSELDTEAETILRLFYPEALVSPVPVNAFRLAGNMGFSVRKAKLSDNFTRPAGIFFEKSEIRYRSGEKNMTGTVPANTILIDTDCIKSRGLDINDVIVHECVHAYEHILFYCLQCLCPSGNRKAVPELEDFAYSSSENEALRWIEHQAVHITPRIRMPLSQLSSKADELYEKYSTLPKKEAYEKIIPELALFYGVSEFTAGKRLNDLIYSRKLQ